MKEREFDEWCEPSIEELEAYAYAATHYRDWQRYSALPREGGMNRQPVIWKLSLDCLMDAVLHGEAEAEMFAEFARDY